MSGTARDYAAFHRASYQGDITHHIKQFMTGGFVFKHQRTVIQITKFADFLPWHADKVGNMVELLLRHFAVVDNDCVIKVSTFYEIGL